MSEWRSIPGYEGRWEASTIGEIRSIPRRRTRGGIIKQLVNKRGYLTVTLGREKHEVHRLIALTFIGPPIEGCEVRHLDGDPLNPAAQNLAYGTRSANVRDKRAHGTDHNVNKTHCPQGHPYDEQNTRLYQGRRYCKTCGNRGSRGRTDHPDYRPEWTPND